MSFRLIINIILLLFSISISKGDIVVNDSLKLKNENLEKTELTSSDAYQMLYQNAKDSNDRIIGTMQWVFGIVVAFLLALLGSQIFFNYRINKKEIENITKGISEKFSELKASLLKDISSNEQESKKHIQKQLENFQNDINNKIENKLKDFSKLLDAYKEVQVKDIEIIKNDLDYKIKNIKIDTQKNEGELWKLKGVKANALSKFTETAILTIEMDYEAKYILGDLIDILKDVTEINKYTYADLEKLVSKLSSKHDELKAKIVSLYRDKKIYMYIDNPNPEKDQEFIKVYVNADDKKA